MLTRLARWWLNRHTHPTHLADDGADTGNLWEPVGECICGRQVTGDDRHIITVIAEDDAALGIDGGSTAMSADFCEAHCPGGCHLGCAIVEA